LSSGLGNRLRIPEYLKSIVLYKKNSPSAIMLPELRAVYAAMLEMQKRLEAAEQK